MSLKRNHYLWIIAILIGSCINTLWAESDSNQFQKAKKLSIDRKWDSAVEAFDKFLSEHPESQWTDDAQFWIAYCLEKKGNDLIAAYMAFEELIQNYPNSVWVDDAHMHQISLAENFVQQGNDNFKDFLKSMLINENRACQHHAALALGRLGDYSALHLLETMQDDPAFGNMAQQLVKELNNPKKAKNQSNDSPYAGSGYLSFNTKSGKKHEKQNEIKSSFLFFATKQYKQYYSMLKKDDSWTEEELFMFGMWEILETDEFEELNNLEGFDRQEWIRKYWKERDPTITTEPNEALDAFKKRVNYAKAKYGSRWNARHFRFLRDQYLRDGWLHAPWDARGQLYIRFGEPDYISPHGFHTEQWEYFRHNVDFIVSQYMTNIYGNAISPGELSHRLNDAAPYYVEFNYIYEKQFDYAHYYGTENFIENMSIEYDKPFDVIDGIAIIPYSIPSKEFKIEKKKGEYVIHYQEHVVVFNTDWEPVFKIKNERRFAKSQKKDWKKEKNLHVDINVPLEPGEYLLAIRLEDEHRDDIGIFKMAFVIN